MRFLWVGVGLALLVKGGELFISAAGRIAEYLRMPPMVIGTRLVSRATNPARVGSLLAGGQGWSEFAVWNAVGSCICNIGLTVGVTAAFRHVDFHLRAVRPPLIAMFGCGALLFLIS